MEILTSGQMRRVDQRAIRGMKIPGIDLMEQAGRRTFDVILRSHPDLKGRRVLVLCGGGNNGGDGLVVARHLVAHGVATRTVLSTPKSALRGDALASLRSAEGIGLAVDEVVTAPAWRRVAHRLREFDLVVDALLGTGLRGPARGLSARMIQDVNASGVSVLAVDIPSGLSGDSDQIPGPAIRADRTVTFCRPKIPHVLPPADSCVGQLSVVDIGIPDEAVEAERAWLHLIEREELADLRPPRRPSSHKGDYGHVLILAGSRDRSGAAALVARASLRGGCGLVTAAIPASAQVMLAPQLAEMMTHPLPETASGTVSGRALEVALELAAERDVLAVGPGLGTEGETSSFVRELVKRARAPLVLDADGINAFAGGHSRALDGRGRVLILTPHPGEMARLTGVPTQKLLANRVASCRRFARGHGLWLVLKGHRTLIGTPDGEVFVNPTGNPGMATAGAGDALTGFLASLLAQRVEPLHACMLAVWLHGRAGDIAAERIGEDSLMASDIISCWPDAVRDLGGASARVSRGAP